MRQPIVAGNWKMNGTVAEAVALARAIRRRIPRTCGVEVVLCPPFTSLAAVAERLSGSPFLLGAQDVHWESAGAYTGEISPGMLRDLSCRYVIVGHSERRTHFAETDRDVNRKARALLEAGLRPIVCVGETVEQRESGRTEEILTQQLEGSLAGIGERLPETVVAYEPVWAIGTGRTASAEQAQAAHDHVRRTIAAMAGSAVAAAVRIQYGGSLTPASAVAIFAGPDVDGGLVGGASQDAASFAGIVAALTARAPGP